EGAERDRPRVQPEDRAPGANRAAGGVHDRAPAGAEPRRRRLLEDPDSPLEEHPAKTERQAGRLDPGRVRGERRRPDDRRIEPRPKLVQAEANEAVGNPILRGVPDGAFERRLLIRRGGDGEVSGAHVPRVDAVPLAELPDLVDAPRGELARA